jgi:hypothetical protein
LGRWSYIGGCSTTDPSNVQSQVTNNLFLLRRLLQLQLCNALGSGWFINIAIEEMTQFCFCLCAVVETYVTSTFRNSEKAQVWSILYFFNKYFLGRNNLFLNGKA